MGLFQQMVSSQKTDYSAYIEFDEYVICSASPELFFKRDGVHITCRPMKGTAPRGLSSADDLRQIHWLASSEKNRAENLMIVDMIRNDLGRVADPGSVDVPELFTVETYPSLHQMTSTVTCRTHAKTEDVIRALFPCASVTGAPKVRTMELIAGLEAGPRGIYTGSIGSIAPGDSARFNVAIRTAFVNRRRGSVEFGTGSGIVWDSEADREYEECRIKSAFVRRKQHRFSLLETMLWEPGRGFFLLDRHLRRLSESAGYFQFPVDMEAVLRELETRVAGRENSALKVRLLVSPRGEIVSECEALGGGNQERAVRLVTAANPVDSDDPFLYHKTTKRDVYEEAASSRPDADDVLLWNGNGEITESCVANVVVRIDGAFCTPPVSCGLLPGTYRQHLLESGVIIERPIEKSILEECPEIYLINSVRRWRRAVLYDKPGRCDGGRTRQT